MDITIPFIPLRGQTFFPNTLVGVELSRDKSLLALEQAMEEDRYLAVAAQKDPAQNDPGQEDCYTTGVILHVKQLVKRGEESVRIMAECESRIRILAIYEVDGVPYCDYRIAEDILPDPDDPDYVAHVRVLKQMYLKYVEMSNSGDAAAQALIDGVDDPVVLVNIIAGELNMSYDTMQPLLEIDDVTVRIAHLIEIISRENQILALSRRINSRVIKNMNRGQREFYLREQLHVIREELGEDDGSMEDEAGAWLERLEALELPEKTDEKLRKEIEKFRHMNAMSPEANVSRTYIETALNLPWHTRSKLNTNIRKAEKILEEDHYGLPKVKERIIEYLAVTHLAKRVKGPIICLVGPPGVGKTSVARSIARATHREFVRMSLGGVRDEAEIRGHRRTYVGAIPGRIINSIIEAGSKNPLFLFDEVDKIGTDFRGDPASALLEVLDPEQNKSFTDHYLEIPFDLSEVMFITTANTTQTIPRPLLDRMEVIEISSYIEEEKLHIAEEHLIPKQLKEHAIRRSQLSISESAVRDIIHYYTREAGVRNLERQIGAVCRKAAKRIVTEKKRKYQVTSRNLERYLGRRLYREDSSELTPQVGVTTGMAWTAVGGVTLEIETLRMPGSGKLILTGQMGDVMKESAQAAVGYLRSIADRYEIAEENFKDYDIQIHIPEGATPKDGPSAGVTMCTALFSTLSGQAVRRDVAMTGEITLRGRILAVGGIKEKVLAAYRHGIRKILLPAENRPDVEEIPASVRRKLEFVYLETAEDAFREVLLENSEEQEASRREGADEHGEA